MLCLDPKIVSSLVISNCYSQMKKKANMSDDFTVFDDFSRSKTCLKRSSKFAPRFKSVSLNTIPENVLTTQDREVSGNPSSSAFKI